jgi:hypothetical protein
MIVLTSSLESTVQFAAITGTELAVVGIGLAAAGLLLAGLLLVGLLLAGLQAAAIRSKAARIRNAGMNFRCECSIEVCVLMVTPIIFLEADHPTCWRGAVLPLLDRVDQRPLAGEIPLVRMYSASWIAGTCGVEVLEEARITVCTIT